MSDTQAVPLADYIAAHGSVSKAAQSLGIDYFKLYRWHRRRVFACEQSRREMLARGIVLPERPALERPTTEPPQEGA